jgi:hypothetical protein
VCACVRVVCEYGVCVVCVVYAATPGVTGYAAQALAFGAHTPARGQWVETSSGFHYTAAPQEVSRDEERGDSTPQMPNGNQDGGHFAQVSVCVRARARAGARERVREREKDFAWIDMSNASLLARLLLLLLLLLLLRFLLLLCHARTYTSTLVPALSHPTFSYSFLCSFHPGSREVPPRFASWSCLHRRRRRRNRMEIYLRARTHLKTHRYTSGFEQIHSHADALIYTNAHAHRGWIAQIAVLPSSHGEEDASPSLP